MTHLSSHARSSLLRRALRALRLRYAELRRMARNFEAGVLVLATLVGAAVGLVTIGLRDLVGFLHRFDFALVAGHLSAQTEVDVWRLALVPAVGGLILGLVMLIVARIRPTEIVDPVEANALFGGKLSLRDSARLTGYTVISNACGASVGMEAGYSQIGAGIFAWVGRYFHLRREDQRTMVTAGAAAAIAAAFNAPLAGAFYGFELIHSSYSTRLLAPVTAAALSSIFVVRLVASGQPLFAVAGGYDASHLHYALFVILGILAAGLGVLTMKAATWFERGFRRVPVPGWARPALGGIVLSALALGSPQVLGSGHGAIEWHLNTPWTATALGLLLIGKLVASAASLGAGFRGGLFSSSLFLGSLLGAFYVQMLGYVDPVLVTDRTAFMLVGMGAVGAAIIGAPFTMVFLVLETTGDFLLSTGVLVGVVIASTLVRLTFGYSFSTWRFHLRGLPLRGGQDIGWISELTAARMMREDTRQVPLAMPLDELRSLVPLGSRKYVFAVNAQGDYSGMIDVAALHDPDITEMVEHSVADDLATCRGCYMFPGDDIQTVLTKFSEAQSETLPVVRSREHPEILGALSEAYCLKRYTQELERQRRDALGMHTA